MNDQMKEIIDRTRRIETKLSRYISGEDDRGVTTVDYTLDRIDKLEYELHVHTLNITMVKVAAILTTEKVPSGAEVDVYDDGKYGLTIIMR